MSGPPSSPFDAQMSHHRRRRKAFATLIDAIPAGPSRIGDAPSPRKKPRREPSGSRSVSSLVLNNITVHSNAHYEERIAGKRLQLANLDRPRPVNAEDSVAGQKLKKRDSRLVKKVQRDRNHLLSSGLAREHSKSKKKESNRQRHRAEGRPLSRRQRKLMGLERVDENISYESLLPIHSMWLAYVQRLVGLSEGERTDKVGNVIHGSGLPLKQDDDAAKRPALQPSTSAQIASAIVKADMCGAPIRVVQSLNPALVGIEGLVANETESTFVIAPKPSVSQGSAHSSNAVVSRTKTIPKRNSVFLLQIALPQHAIMQNKSQLAHAPSAQTSLVPSQPCISPFPFKEGEPASTSQATSSPCAIEIHLYGNQLCNSLPTRATRKYKARKTIELQ